MLSFPLTSAFGVAALLQTLTFRWVGRSAPSFIDCVEQFAVGYKLALAVRACTFAVLLRSAMRQLSFVAEMNGRPGRGTWPSALPPILLFDPGGAILPPRPHALYADVSSGSQGRALARP
jgi:hypothetical protein